ncbi:MAG: hypothetical protein IPJ52_01480 [Rhodocyclaceae bacterium]|nr:hypothetical protein [Rhodocyclaceae bacterium]
MKGMRWLAWRRLRSAVRARMAAPAAGEPEATVDFLCNVCGRDNHQVPLIQVQNREFQSCRHCRSSLRMRSLIYRLSKELFGRVLPLPEFPVSKEIVGIGMSDWEGYARSLEQCFAYTNTFYHQPPHLDITDVSEEMAGRADFLLSSDVFEHIPGFALGYAFKNARRLLRDKGCFLFTVPFVKTGGTREHFPRLYDFRIITTAGKRFLYNRTVEGDEEIFDNLVFHGGDGATLEMRMFSETDLLQRLTAAGFCSIEVCVDNVPEYGILWPMDWAVPIVARA